MVLEKEATVETQAEKQCLTCSVDWLLKIDGIVNLLRRQPASLCHPVSARHLLRDLMTIGPIGLDAVCWKSVSTAWQRIASSVANGEPAIPDRLDPAQPMRLPHRPLDLPWESLARRWEEQRRSRGARRGGSTADRFFKRDSQISDTFTEKVLGARARGTRRVRRAAEADRAIGPDWRATSRGLQAAGGRQERTVASGCRCAAQPIGRRPAPPSRSASSG